MSNVHYDKKIGSFDANNSVQLELFEKLGSDALSRGFRKKLYLLF